MPQPARSTAAVAKASAAIAMVVRAMAPMVAERGPPVVGRAGELRHAPRDARETASWRGDVAQRPASRATTRAAPKGSLWFMRNVITAPRLAAAIIPLGLVIIVLAVRGGNADAGSTTVPVSSGASAVQQQFLDVVHRVSPAVVQIQTKQGLGSGIVYDESGDIVTNAHVTGTSKRFLVTLAGGHHESATLVGTDPSHDIAVVHVAGEHPAQAVFAPASGVQSGDIVFAIGNPLGLQSSVTQGIVSNLNRNVSEGNGVTLTDVIQTSAEINPGNSGGALVDLSGRVVGIPTLAALDPDIGDAPAPGIGFAISSDTVQRIAGHLISANA
jgi:putative serine protease PepD